MGTVAAMPYGEPALHTLENSGFVSARCQAVIGEIARLASIAEDDSAGPRERGTATLKLGSLLKTELPAACPWASAILDESCGEAVYQTSMLAERLFDDFRGDGAQRLVGDAQDLVFALPNALASCGAEGFSDRMEKALPPACTEAAGKAAAFLPQLEANYMRLEWVFAHRKQLAEVARGVFEGCGK